MYDVRVLVHVRAHVGFQVCHYAYSAIYYSAAHRPCLQEPVMLYQAYNMFVHWVDVSIVSIFLYLSPPPLPSSSSLRRPGRGTTCRPRQDQSTHSHGPMPVTEPRHT